MFAAAQLYGPVYVAADPAAMIRLLVGVGGMEVVGSRDLGPAEARALWGPDVEGVTMTCLRTPGVDAGAIVLDCARPDVPAIRTGASRLHRDALRVVDLYAPDLAAAVAHARALGHHVEAHQADYALTDGAFREAHLIGPDETVTAFLTGDPTFFTDFARVRDRVVSEVLSISFPVSDLAGTRDWYADTFGWEVVFEYSFEDPSFGRMVGVDGPLRVVSQTVGAARDEPYVNLVDYGLDSDPTTSLAGRSRAPARGLLGLAVLVDRLEGPQVRIGDLTCATIHSPQAVPHLVVQR